MTEDIDRSDEMLEMYAQDGDTDERPLYPPPTAPLDVAHKLYAEHRQPGGRTLVSWRAGWMSWHGPHWSEMDTAELRSGIYDALGKVDYEHPIRERGRVVDYEVRPWSPDKYKVANVIEAMAAIGHLSAEIDPPSWIDVNCAAKMPAARMISCENGLLELTKRTLCDHTPALFNVVSVPFAYDHDAATPTVWLGFLASIWPDDPNSVALLQEYMGYVLCGRTDMQKMLLLIGPTRSGKGTIARLLTELVGRGHVAGPTLASMGTNFGLSPLLGKPLAIISDARLGNAPTHTVVERLLSITGEDMLTVDRKFRDPWSGKLPTRFVVLSNELPRFKDSSGAIANRMLILQMTSSFLGREDRTLDDRLRAELPGILAWALDGLDRLTSAGRFTVPESSRDAENLMMDLASPMSAFVRECCVRHSGEEVLADRLYDAWRTWTADNGHVSGAKSTFGRDLRAVVPELKVSQPTIDGNRFRMYHGIGLGVIYALNGVDPVHPVQDSACTGCGARATTAKPLVKGRCTGCTGTTAFKANTNGRGHFCTGCGTYPEVNEGRHRADCTNGGAR
jgi:putative DNA primase/helicase